jgi:predicted nucleotidyltransferase
MELRARQVLQQIVASLKHDLPTEVVSVRAFGSRIRGDHDGNSDFDVLVLVKHRTTEIQERIITAFVTGELESGIPFEPVIKTLDSFAREERYHTLFYRNIVNESVLI